MSARKPAMPVNIILLGDPAAGKATQAAYLAKKYKLYDFDMGQELNNARAKDEKLDAILKRNTDQGKLTPTKICRDILRNVVSSVPVNQGILFDGHPKMLGEAKLAAGLLKKQKRPDPIVFYLSIPLNETVKRMKNRTGYFKGKFGKRADDSDNALKNRAKYYRINIAQVVEYFSKQYQFHKISGMGSRSEVQKQFAAIMKEFTESK